MIVDIFIPCYIDQFYPGTAQSMVKVLERLNCGVNYNIEQTCCGRPAFEDGYWDHCKEVGEKLIREFQEDRYIVCPASTCVATVKNQYASIFHNTSLHNEYKMVQKHMYEFSDFLVNVLNASDLGARYPGKAVFLDSCSAVHDLGIKEAPRMLLSNVRDLEMLNMGNSSLPCCGLGGGLDRKDEKLTVQMAEEVIKAATNEGANIIISTDYDCLMHLNGVIHKNNYNLKTAHIADVLATGWQ
ncbi:(Fe-S)-binding protein [soil metagenome]